MNGPNLSTTDMDKAYISNLSASWPIKRQEALLAERVPGWPVATYRDELRPRALRDRDTSKLEQRESLTRPSSRKGRDTLHVATLAVVAFRAPEFRAYIDELGKRKTILVAHQEGETCDLARAKGRQRAVEQFPISRTRAGKAIGLASGAQVSAARRNAASEAACAPIRERWKLPSDLYATEPLIAETGLSRNTVTKVLGKRPAAQRRHARNLKRLEAKAAAALTQETATP